MTDCWWEDSWSWGSTLAIFKRVSAIHAELSQTERTVDRGAVVAGR